MSRHLHIISAAAVWLAGASALAQTVPAGVTMDRFGDRSTIGGSFGYIAMDIDDVTALRFDAYAAFISSSGSGGYFQIPFSFVDSDVESESALGNVEIGIDVSMGGTGAARPAGAAPGGY